ncbi:hypothetical protein ACWKSP_41870 [Micromonosporaceae bacterium Da 78-11]
MTGGTDGIGRALAGTYLERGYEVLVIDGRREGQDLPGVRDQPRSG